MMGLSLRIHSAIKVAVAVLVGVLTITQAGSAIAPATATYRFVGTCTDCTGTGTGMLILQNYTLGSALSNSNFVSFSYTSNLINYTLTPSFTAITGSLPTSLPGPANISITPNMFPNNQFFSEIPDSAAWCAGNDCEGDIGTNGVWSLVTAAPTSTPAPNTFALAGIALVLVLLAQILVRRKQHAIR